VTTALLFDLDETLVVEEPAAAAAFLSTAWVAAARHGLDASALAAGARRRARELWRAAPTFPYCRRIGISSWEGLWCLWEGDHDDVRRLRAWAPTYRRETWKLALADADVVDTRLAEELGERFGTERRSRHEVFADARSALEELRRKHPLAVVTNGASCLQREKVEASGLADYFDAIVISGELGAGKPDASIFRHALARLGVSGDRAVMVGDSLARDVDGATAAGIRGVWLNRDGQAPSLNGHVQISSLAELAALV
jgi:putative hydrolase of the HAD superfamily